MPTDRHRRRARARLVPTNAECSTVADAERVPHTDRAAVEPQNESSAPQVPEEAGARPSKTAWPLPPADGALRAPVLVVAVVAITSRGAWGRVGPGPFPVLGFRFPFPVTRRMETRQSGNLSAGEGLRADAAFGGERVAALPGRLGVRSPLVFDMSGIDEPVERFAKASIPSPRGAECRRQGSRVRPGLWIALEQMQQHPVGDWRGRSGRTRARPARGTRGDVESGPVRAHSGETVPLPPPPSPPCSRRQARARWSAAPRPSVPRT
jgi:hypothetical protein